MDSVDFFFLFAFFLFFFSVFPDLSLIFLSHSNSNNFPQYSGDGEEAAAVGPVVSASEAANHSRPLGSPAAGAAPPSSQQQGLWFFLRFHNAPRVHTLAHLPQVESVSRYTSDLNRMILQN